MYFWSAIPNLHKKEYRLHSKNQSRYLLKALPVGFIKCIQIFAVYIQNGHDLAFPENRDYYFAAGKTAAGDVAGKPFNIGDDNAQSFTIISSPCFQFDDNVTKPRLLTLTGIFCPFRRSSETCFLLGTRISIAYLAYT